VPDLQSLPIGEVARRTGLAPSAIRYYESEALLDTPLRTHGWRAYPPSAVERLQVIRMARELGFSLGDIRVLFTGFTPDTPPSTRWQTLARAKLPEVDAAIQRATAMKGLLEKGLRCDCLSIADCIVYDCNPPVSIGRRATSPPGSR
jgi:MerR family transcriptional regulator, redox-sensitive transcriptional activator SoxR